MKLILNTFQIKPKIKFDRKPDGVKTKLISSKIARSYGWFPKILMKD